MKPTFYSLKLGEMLLKMKITSSFILGTEIVFPASIATVLLERKSPTSNGQNIEKPCGFRNVLPTLL